MKKIIALLTLIVVCGQPLFAAANLTGQGVGVEAQARAYTYSCGYYSNKTADVLITLTATPDQLTPTAADAQPMLSLQYGWNTTYAYTGRQQLGLDGVHGGELAMAEVSTGVWQVNVNSIVAARSSPLYFNQLEFTVFGLKNPQKYLVQVDIEKSLPCISGPESFPAYGAAKVVEL